MGAYLESKLWILCIGFEVALAITLYRRKLAGRYPCLFALTLVNTARDLFLTLMSDVASESYPKLWVLTLPGVMFVQVAAVTEAHKRFTERYQGLETFASYLLRGSIALLVVISCASAAYSFHTFTESALQAILFTYRYIAFVLAGLLVLCRLVFWRLPKPEKRPARNARVHVWILVAYFGVYCLSYSLTNLLGAGEATITIINVFMMASLCCTYALWAFLLTPSGETSVPWPMLDRELALLINRQGEDAIRRSQKLAACFQMNAQESTEDKRPLFSKRTH